MASTWTADNASITADNTNYLADGTVLNPSLPASPVLPNGGPGLYGNRVTYNSVLVGEIAVLPTDFISKLQVGESILSAVATISVYSGIDSNPSAMLAGTPTVSGTVVNTLIAPTVVGCIYEVKILAVTSLGQTLVLTGYLAVVPDLP